MAHRWSGNHSREKSDGLPETFDALSTFACEFLMPWERRLIIYKAFAWKRLLVFQSQKIVFFACASSMQPSTHRQKRHASKRFSQNVHSPARCPRTQRSASTWTPPNSFRLASGRGRFVVRFCNNCSWCVHTRRTVLLDPRFRQQRGTRV